MEEGEDDGVTVADVKTDLEWDYQRRRDTVLSLSTHNMSGGVLGLFPPPAPAQERHEEEGGPEDEVGGGQDLQDPHSSQSLLLDLSGDAGHVTENHRQLANIFISDRRQDMLSGFVSMFHLSKQQLRGLKASNNQFKPPVGTTGDSQYRENLKLSI